MGWHPPRQAQTGGHTPKACEVGRIRAEADADGRASPRAGADGQMRMGRPPCTPAQMRGGISWGCRGSAGDPIGANVDVRTPCEGGNRGSNGFHWGGRGRSGRTQGKPGADAVVSSGKGIRGKASEARSGSFRGKAGADGVVSSGEGADRPGTRSSRRGRAGIPRAGADGLVWSAMVNCGWVGCPSGRCERVSPFQLKCGCATSPETQAAMAWHSLALRRRRLDNYFWENQFSSSFGWVDILVGVFAGADELASSHDMRESIGGYSPMCARTGCYPLRQTRMVWRLPMAQSLKGWRFLRRVSKRR